MLGLHCDVVWLQRQGGKPWQPALWTGADRTVDGRVLGLQSRPASNSICLWSITGTSWAQQQFKRMWAALQDAAEVGDHIQDL